MNRRKVVVIAGTPVDTGMGVEYLQGKGADIEPIYRPVAEDCEAQLHFQYSDYEGKRKRLDEIFDAEIADGARDFFIYCNSLSGAFDFDSYEKEKSEEIGENVHIYTPLQAYKKLGRKYHRIGVMAANNLSAHAIEETLLGVNNRICVIGTGNMAVVRAIEDGLDPGKIVDVYGLDSLIEYMECCGAEAVILGCTHFPYFKEELERCSSLPLIDPADMMYEELSLFVSKR